MIDDFANLLDKNVITVEVISPTNLSVSKKQYDPNTGKLIDPLIREISIEDAKNKVMGIQAALDNFNQQLTDAQALLNQFPKE